MAMPIEVAGVPERASEAPQEIDQFSHPQVAREVPAIYHQGEEEGLLKLRPFTREAAAKQLAPA